MPGKLRITRRSRRRSDRGSGAVPSPVSDSPTQTAPSEPAEEPSGFRPGDKRPEAPTSLRDARAAFAAALGPERGTEVDDPRDALPEEERQKQREELEGFIEAQRAGEALSGVVPRR